VKQTLRRVFCKLDVSGRAQMAATMTARGWIQPCAPSPFETLSAREREIVRLSMRGHHAKSIACEMGIAYSTVRVLKARLVAKLGVHGWREAIEKCDVPDL
jgi:DNA-binding CsgD family transcriptional regulator